MEQPHIQIGNKFTSIEADPERVPEKNRGKIQVVPSTIHYN